LRNILTSSFFVKLLSAAAGWIDAQFGKSVIATAFLRDPTGRGGGSVFGRVFDFLHGALFSLFRLLRLDRALAGSVFRRTFFWCTLVLVMAPLIPTMAVLGLVLVCFVSLVTNFGCDRSLSLASSPVNIFIYLFALIYAVCTLTSVDFRGSLNGGMLTVAFVLFSIALQSAIKTKKQTDTLVHLLIAAGVIVAGYGVLQYVLGVEGAEAWLDDEMFDTLSIRVYSTLDNPNVLAEYLLLIIPLAVSVVFTAKSQSGKIYALCATGVMCLAMLLTLSRGGWLGLVFAAAVFLVLMDRRFIVLGLIAAAAAVLVLPESVLGRFTSIGDMSDGSTSYRFSIWMGSLAMLADYWFCGIGPGTAAFNKVYPLYSYNTATAQHAHNLYLQITCETGIIGLLVFVMLLFMFFKTTCSAVSRAADKTVRLRLIAVISGILGFLLQSMTDFTFYNYRVALIFWAFIALGMILSRKDMISAEKATEGSAT